MVRKVLLTAIQNDAWAATAILKMKKAFEGRDSAHLPRLADP
jgi:hypothetical protein